MGMRIRAAHSRTLVLEDLHPSVLLGELLKLLNPSVDDRSDLLRAHYRQSFVAFRMEAHHATCSASSAGLEERIIRFRWHWNVLEESGKVVGENKRRIILRIPLPVLTSDTGAKWIGGVEVGQVVLLSRLLLTRPGSLHSVW